MLTRLNSYRIYTFDNNLNILELGLPMYDGVGICPTLIMKFLKFCHHIFSSCQNDTREKSTGAVITLFVTVDVASVDRRDPTREEESLKRVGSLVEAFKSSSIHTNTVKDITDNRSKLPAPNHEEKEPGPGAIRVFNTVVR